MSKYISYADKSAKKENVVTKASHPQIKIMINKLPKMLSSMLPNMSQIWKLTDVCALMVSWLLWGSSFEISTVAQLILPFILDCICSLPGPLNFLIMQAAFRDEQESKFY